MSTAELAIVYSALILQDGQVEITADNLQKLVKAAGIQIDAAWFSVFAKALEGQDLKDLLSGFSAPGAATAGAGGAAPAAAGDAPAAEEAKEEEAEESDEDMGFGLFD